MITHIGITTNLAECMTVITNVRTQLAYAVDQPKVLLACFSCVLAWRESHITAQQLAEIA